MNSLPHQLSSDTALRYESFKDFAGAQVAPFAAGWDEAGEISKSVLTSPEMVPFLGGIFPEAVGGKGWDMTLLGLLHEAIGAHSVSLSAIFNVHTMTGLSISKWGSEVQKSKWLPAMANGTQLGAIAFTEPEAGSDLSAMQTAFEVSGDQLILNGKKCWITNGQHADVFLVFGKQAGNPMACLIERDRPGFTIEPVSNMTGHRGSNLAHLTFDQCAIPQENQLGKTGAGLLFYAPFALEIGRLVVAWSAAGLLRTCLEQVVAHTVKRKVFGKELIQLGNIQSLITEMKVAYRAAVLLCLDASSAKQLARLDKDEAVLTAKYFSTVAAGKHSAIATRILGAAGCVETHPLARAARDAKILEIIEGSTELLQSVLAR